MKLGLMLAFGPYVEQVLPGLERIGVAFALLALLATNGCISAHVVQNKTKAHLEYDPETNQHNPVEGKPGYYALLPLTVAGDIATSPIQLVYFAGRGSWPSGHTSIHGVPIPFP